MNERMTAVRESKQAMRRRLAALPLDEKIAILEKLRDRSLAIARSPLRRSSASPPTNPPRPPE